MPMRVPYLREEQIENDAAVLLAEYEQARGVKIERAVPIEDIVEKHLRLGIEFDDMHRLLNHPRSGLGVDSDILGAIFFKERRIVIDESLDPEENPNKEGRYRFTLAHEGGGHWRLHRLLFAKDAGQASMLNEPEPPSVVCRSSQARQPVEWQADFYASCLLMPRRLVFEAWHAEFGTHEPFAFDPEKHKADGVRGSNWSGWRSIGEVCREMTEPGHVRFFDQIAKRLAPTFCVSPQAMRIRLEKLGLLLRRASPQESLPIGR